MDITDRIREFVWGIDTYDIDETDVSEDKENYIQAHLDCIFPFDRPEKRV